MRRLVLLTAALSLGLPAAPAAASLCAAPGQASPAAEEIHGSAVVATAPVGPEDFLDRGRSLAGNPAGRTAAWEAHVNAPVIEGPTC